MEFDALDQVDGMMLGVIDQGKSKWIANFSLPTTPMTIRRSFQAASEKTGLILHSRTSSSMGSVTIKKIEVIEIEEKSSRAK